MVKGINKQMIVLKLEGNRIYDSACFILKNEVQRSKDNQNDMLYEANRLLGEMDIKKYKGKKKGFWRKLIFALSFLILGAVIGFGVSFFI